MWSIATQPCVLQWRPDARLPSPLPDLTSHPHRLPPARMHITTPTSASHQRSLTSPTPHTSPFRCPIALPSYHPNPTHDSSAPRRQLDGGVAPAADRRGGGQARP